ncbi:MAG: zinc-dependent metalloprotease family protein, partial [Kiritimatiellales bacterium]
MPAVVQTVKATLPGGTNVAVNTEVCSECGQVHPGRVCAMYGGRALMTLNDLPPGKVRSTVEKLPAEAQQHALLQLSRMNFRAQDEASVRVDGGGFIYYVCNLTAEETPVPEHSSVAEAGVVATESSAAALPEYAPVPVSTPPIYHSKPGSTKVLFLDFNGQTISNTIWNTSYTVTVWRCTAFDTDGDTNTFSDTEQRYIKQIWERVSEDYAVYDVDVTTEQPAVWNKYTAHALITPTTDANGIPCPHFGYGGVAYVTVFGDNNYSYNSANCYSPAWVKPMVGPDNNYSSAAEAASHEVGHNMGLHHDGTSTLEYYGGHGSGDTSWGPIMGTGYGRNVSQWSKGEYYDANRTEDDLSIISTKTPYRADDHGNTNSTATAMTVSNGVGLVSSGIISSTSDVDVFSFLSGVGTMSITVFPYHCSNGTYGGNLDVAARLYNSSGVLVQSNNSPSLTQAVISYNAPTSGVYYLHISDTGTGNPLSSSPDGYTAYGSIGQYSITGAVPPTVTLSLSGSPMAEAGGTATVTAALSSPYTQPVTVNLAFSGTATPAADCTRSGTNIVIAAGSTTNAITLTAKDDLIYEGDETVIVAISSVVNGSSSGTQQVTATITDDDMELGVTPLAGVTFIAPAGGVTSPSNQVYVLTNAGTSTFNWTASRTGSWVNLSATDGTLAVGAATNVTVSANAGALAEGTYSDTITFINTSRGVSQTRPVSLTVVLPYIYFFPLDTDPGWTRSGEWAFGHPAGLGGGTQIPYPDPSNGATGTNVFGVNLNGNYSLTNGGFYYLTAGPLNFSGYTNVFLHFQRWLNTDIQGYADATIDISSNGTAWARIYTNNSVMADTATNWIRCQYNISGAADRRTNVYIRWGYNATPDTAYAASGWNIDDVGFLGTSIASVYTVTFDAQGGAAASPVSMTVTNGATYGTLAATARSGYAFGG